MANGDNPKLAAAPRNAEGYGVGLKFDRNTYQVKNMVYPADLMDANNKQYGGNYVIFYINVHEDSFLAKNNEAAYVAGNPTARQRGDVAGLSTTGVRGAALVAGGAAGAAAKPVTKAAGAVGADLKGPIATVANIAAGGVLAEAAIQTIGGAKKSYKQMREVIALYVPNEMSVRYSANWGAEDLAGSNALAAISENIPLGPNQVGAGASYAAGLALKTPGVGGLVSKASGTAANPKKEQLFQEVDFRTFNFNYQFFPRSSQESRNIQEIIKTFKLHMHPEFRDAYHFLYIYPSEFDIYYYQNGKENMNLHRHTSCVLTDMTVTYSPQGTFSTFADGMPTQINVSMTFKELALLSKETIQDGF